jgi:hypothetical protein
VLEQRYASQEAKAKISYLQRSMAQRYAVHRNKECMLHET